jgi:hypothetical protein
VPYGLIRGKNGKKHLFQVFFEVFLSDDVDESSKIVCSKHQPDIGAGPFHPFFHQDVIKAPLSLDRAKGMLNDRFTVLI